MALFNVDFVFSCPCFVSNIQQALLKSTKNFEIVTCVSGTHIVKNFGIDYFKKDRTIFICCYDHLLDGMQYDTQSCLHYNRRDFFRMCQDGSLYKIKKSFRFYRRSIRRLLKYYLRFIC